jgi:hypothetical protein
MNAETKKLLLSNQRAVEEIRRHLWIESEKAGHDIGFDNAAEDWLAKYAKAWMAEYMPQSRPSAGMKKTAEGPKKTLARKRAAKTYL